jgi:tetratricopeptide (TPR) repeat protein
MQSLLRCKENDSQKSHFPNFQGALLMKKILLTVVLGVAVVAVAQAATQPAQQGQPAASPTSSVNPPTGSVNPPTGQAAQSTPAAAPVIKDPAEYNAYVAAYQAKDANAKISGLEAFLAQYPNSVMKNQALEILMQAYQQANNVKKALETATKLLAVDPCHVPSLFLLSYVDRVTSQGGDPNGKQLATDGAKYGQTGLDCLPKFAKPEGASDADFQKMKDQMKGNFHAAVGWGALQDKNNAKAAEELKAALDANPPDSQKDLSLVYPLALSYLGETPPDYQNGIWFAARAAAVAPAANAPGIEKYARSQYVKFHSADDGWAEVLAAAKANAAQMPIKPAPTPAEQAHAMIAATSPEKMDFAQWEFVLTNGSQEDQDIVWNAIKGKAVQMVGTVISTEPTQFMVAGSSDDIEVKKADITLKFEDKIPAKMIPKDGFDNFQFQGEPASYTPNPFMMTMEKGQLLRAKPAPTTPAHKPPVHHKPAAQ